jgi:hypothetical protein
MQRLRTLPSVGTNAVFDRNTYALGMRSPTMRLQIALLIKRTALCRNRIYARNRRDSYRTNPIPASPSGSRTLPIFIGSSGRGLYTVSGRTTGSRRTCGTSRIFISTGFALNTGDEASIDDSDFSFPLSISHSKTMLAIRAQEE